MTQTKRQFEYPIWYQNYPKWLRSAVLAACRKKQISLNPWEKSKHGIVAALINDGRFRRLLDHTGGEDGAFIAEPYQTVDSIRSEADAFAAMLGCTWQEKPGTWHPGTIRIEFRLITDSI